MILISIAVAIGLNNILLLVDLAQYSEAYRKAAEVLYSPSFAEQILYNSVLIPILEEIIFRGLLFSFLRKHMSFLWSMTLSAVLFGLYHGNLVQFVYAGLIGFLLAYFREKFGSVKAPILSHIVMNITVCVLTKFGGFEWMFENMLRFTIITSLCGIVSVAMFVSIQKLDVTKLLKKHCKHMRDVI